METIIKKSGMLIFRFNRKLRWIFNIRILRNHNTTILFILLVCFLILLFGFWGVGFSINHVILYSTIAIIVLFLILLILGSLNEAQRLSNQAPYNCFQFHRSNLNGIHLQGLGFTEQDRENINLVLNGLEIKSKIDFKLISDNRAAGDYKSCFAFFT